VSLQQAAISAKLFYCSSLFYSIAYVRTAAKNKIKKTGFNLIYCSTSRINAANNVRKLLFYCSIYLFYCTGADDITLNRKIRLQQRAQCSSALFRCAGVWTVDRAIATNLLHATFARGLRPWLRELIARNDHCPGGPKQKTYPICPRA